VTSSLTPGASCKCDAVERLSAGTSPWQTAGSFAATASKAPQQQVPQLLVASLIQSNECMVPTKHRPKESPSQRNTTKSASAIPTLSNLTDAWTCLNRYRAHGNGGELCRQIGVTRESRTPRELFARKNPAEMRRMFAPPEPARATAQAGGRGICFSRQQMARTARSGDGHSIDQPAVKVELALTR